MVVPLSLEHSLLLWLKWKVSFEPPLKLQLVSFLTLGNISTKAYPFYENFNLFLPLSFMEILTFLFSVNHHFLQLPRAFPLPRAGCYYYILEALLR